MEQNKLKILIECRGFMDELNKNELKDFIESLSDTLTSKELKAIIFCGLNECKNNIEYDKFVQIQQTLTQKEESKPINTIINKVIVDQDENKTNTIKWNLQTLPNVMLSNICQFLKRNDMISLRNTSRQTAIFCFEEMNKIPLNVMNAMKLLQIDQSTFYYFNIHKLLKKGNGLQKSVCINRIGYIYQNEYNIPINNQLITHLSKNKDSVHEIQIIDDNTKTLDSIPREECNFIIFDKQNIGYIQQTNRDEEEMKLLLSRYSEVANPSTFKKTKLIILKYFDIDTQKLFIVDFIVVDQFIYLSQIDQYILNDLIEKYKNKIWAKKFDKYLQKTSEKQLPFELYKEHKPSEAEQSIEDELGELLIDDDRLCNVFLWDSRFTISRRSLITAVMRKHAPSIGGVRRYNHYEDKYYEDYYDYDYEEFQIKADILIFQKNAEYIDSLTLQSMEYEAIRQGNQFYMHCNDYINDQYMRKQIVFKYNGNDDNKYKTLKLIIPISFTFNIICYKIANNFGFTYNDNIKIYRIYKSNKIEVSLDTTMKEEYIRHYQECEQDEEYVTFWNECCNFRSHSENEIDEENESDLNDDENYEYRFKFEWTIV